MTNIHSSLTQYDAFCYETFWTGIYIGNNLFISVLCQFNSTPRVSKLCHRSHSQKLFKSQFHIMFPYVRWHKTLVVGSEG